MARKDDFKEHFIEIFDIPEEFTEEITFLMYLENTVDGFQQITIQKYNNSLATALISTKSGSIAENILKYGFLKWKNEMMHTRTTDVSDKHQINHKDLLPVYKKVQLIGDFGTFKCHEMLLLYLESDRNGGGNVKDFDMQSCRALVTFEDSNVAQSFSSRNHEFNGIKFKAILKEEWPAANSCCGLEIMGDHKLYETHLMCMFENARHGGESRCVEEVFMDKEDCCRAVITLKSHKNVEQILQSTKGSIKTSMEVLTLKQMSPANPPNFVQNPDLKKLLFLELSSHCLLEVKKLKEFVEKCSNASICQLVFCPKNDRVLVEFNDKPDYGNVLNILCCKPFQGVMISVQRIAKTKKIQVIGWKDPEEHLVYSIESQRNGGRTVRKTHKVEDDIWIVTFEDCDAAETVLRNSKEIFKNEISVMPYIKELGYIPKGFDSSKPPSLSPHNVIISIGKEVYGFLYVNMQYRKDIEDHLSKLHCSISWPSSASNLDVILCWNGSHAQSQNLKSWASKVKQRYQELLEDYDFMEITISDLTFEFVVSEIRKFKPGKDKLLKKVDEQFKKVLATGLKDYVKQLKNLINDKDVLAKNTEQKLVKFNYLQYFLITKSKSYKDMKKDCGSRVNILEDNQQHSVLLKGQSKLVKKFELTFEELKGRITKDDVGDLGKYPKFCDFFMQELVLNRIEKEFHSQNIIAVLCVVCGTLMLHSFDDSTIGLAKDCLKSMFATNELKINASESDITTHKDWNIFTNSLLECFNKTFTWNKTNENSFHILAFKKDLDKVSQEFHKYFNEHSKINDVLIKSQAEVKFLMNLSEFIEIQTKAKVDDIEIKVVEDGPKAGFQLSGENRKLISIKRNLEQLCSKVIHKSFRLDNKARNLFNPQFSNVLRGICGKSQVFITLKDSEFSYPENDEKFANVNPKCKIIVVTGSIAEQRTDVIFNCCPPNMELNHSAISKALLNSAGPKLQDDLKAACKDKELSYGEICETPGHSLHCNQVYHGCIMPWNKNYIGSEETIRMLIKNSLDKASQDKQTSISFPAFGTGKLGVPHKQAASIMLDEAANFDCKYSSLKEIYFVIHQDDDLSFQAFKNELKKVSDEKKYDASDEKKYNASDENKGLSAASDKSILLKVNKVCLKALNKDLVQETCDVIVNATSRSFKGGSLSQAIMDKAGHSVKEECDKIGTINNGLEVTISGDMKNCMYIFHVPVSHNSDWQKIISNVLEEANCRGLKSISMPLLGTGHLKVTVENMTEMIVSSFMKFSKSFKNPSLQELKIMIPNDSMFQKFVEAVKGSSYKNDKRGTNYNNSSKNKVEIEICGLTSDCIEYAYKEITKELMEIVTHKEIDHSVKNIPSDLFSSIVKKHSVRIMSTNKTITITGDSDISNAIQEVNELLKLRMKEEHEINELKSISKYVTWSYYLKDGKSVNYGLHSNGKIENAYQQQESNVKFSDKERIKHSIDFKEMEDTNSRNESFRVCRTIRGSMALPNHWDPMVESDIVKLVPLQANSREFLDVNNLFHAGTLKPAIVKIERIQNPSLFKQYECKRLDLKNKNRDVEVRVWHGTSPQNVTNINAHNFNRSLGNQGSYGIGVYFAVNADYSIGGYCQALNGLKCIYLAKVLVGKVGQGVSGMREPPILNPSTGERYDSVADVPSQPRMYIIFYDCLMYPQYLITFK